MTEMCESCGKPMVSQHDHAGSDNDCPYCTTCADHECDLLSRKAVEKKLVKRLVKEKSVDKHLAQQHVQRHLDDMPAWR